LGKKEKRKRGNATSQITAKLILNLTYKGSIAYPERA
jgi:hypothetical protein